MIRSILIADRGEIAVRIIRTCREMGIRTVAVYSDADAEALHVDLADTAIGIGPAADSYVNSEAILGAAAESGVDAIHPGAGGLADSVGFAQAVRAAEVVFIGPPVQALQTLASKTAGLAVIHKAGVPVLPHYSESQIMADLTSAAEQMGYPVVLKSALGTDGESSERIVHAASALEEALESVKREAQTANGQSDLALEKYIAEPRCVEFQIFGDSHANLIHLGERECSIQRRQQVIVGETPSPALHPDLRARMGRAAVAAARSIGYVGAGTVVFLLDGEENYYFCKLNAGLQLAHPLTELVTGLDLVRWQIRVADGEHLPLRQEQIQTRGHAISCHIYAEDPASGFRPTIGTLLRLVEPSGPGIRVDTGVRAGGKLSQDYSPLLASVSAYAENRAATVNRMGRALREYIALGDLTTNTAFLQDVIAHPVFQAGETTTGFVNEHFADWQPFGSPGPDGKLVAAALAEFQAVQARVAGLGPRDKDPRTAWQQLLAYSG